MFQSVMIYPICLKPHGSIFVCSEFFETGRFCACNVLGFGSTFFDLVVHCSSYIRSYMQVVYGKPNPQNLQFAKTIMDLTLPVRLKKLQFQYDDDLEGSKKQSILEKRTQLFLEIFNGDWKDSSPSGLKHVCRIGCSCGGLDRSKLADLAANLFVEIVLASRPTVPALSRWLKCSKSAKWFLNGA